MYWALRSGFCIGTCIAGCLLLLLSFFFSFQQNQPQKSWTTLFTIPFINRFRGWAHFIYFPFINRLSTLQWLTKTVFDFPVPKLAGRVLRADLIWTQFEWRSSFSGAKYQLTCFRWNNPGTQRQEGPQRKGRNERKKQAREAREAKNRSPWDIHQSAGSCGEGRKTSHIKHDIIISLTYFRHVIHVIMHSCELCKVGQTRA